MLVLIAAALIVVVHSPKVPSSPGKPPTKKAAVVAPAAPAPPPPVVGPIDPGVVQSIDVVEVRADPGCPELLDRDRRFCGSGRRFALRRAERERALALINGGGAPRACAERPTHAFLVQATTGPRIVTVSFRCKTIGGRSFTGTVEQDAAAFFRAQGLVDGL
jgi:hypothetical protein